MPKVCKKKLKRDYLLKNVKERKGCIALALLAKLVWIYYYTVCDTQLLVGVAVFLVKAFIIVVRLLSCAAAFYDTATTLPNCVPVLLS